MEEDVLLNKPIRLKKRSKKQKIKITIASIMISFVIVSFILSFTVGTRRSYFVLNRYSAKWINTNGQTYLHLDAENEYELGKLEGKYLSAKIVNLKRILQAFGIAHKKEGFGYEDMIQMALKYEKNIPIQFIQEMQGIDAAILGIDYEDVLLQNCFIDILYGQYYPDTSMSSAESTLHIGCTVVGYKNNDTVVIGQNFDFTNIFKHTLSFVYHQVEGKQAQFSLRIGGIVSTPCGLNSAGTSIFINVVKTNVIGSYSTPIAFRIRQAFDTTANPDEFLSEITKENSTLSMNLMIANISKLISVETIPGNFSITVKNQDVNTNTFTDTFLQQFLLDPVYSKDRQNTTEEILYNSTLDGYFSKSEFVSIMSDPAIYQSKSGLLGVSTLVCISTDFFYRGIISQTTQVSPLPVFS